MEVRHEGGPSGMFEMMTTLVVVPEKVRVDAIVRALTS